MLICIHFEKKNHSSILSLIIRLFYVIIYRMWNSHFLPKTDIDGRKRAQNTNTRVCFRIEWRTNWCKNLIFSNKRSELKTKIEISKPKLKERNNSRRRHMMSYEDKGGDNRKSAFLRDRQRPLNLLNQRVTRLRDDFHYPNNDTEY